ncbi:hypothetical protein NLJ89_g441 [Agrocybe chaxingu]|uniref:non-reducing end alpha-L-arabinofuranosidase n=1 Tax=Agrocybe chaxingu TaxID=84603 RepID=A0A9W8TGH1_9AGAR|nr:hypothetical protein NLJ89_g441 [Agrocybe chaxingu]
MLSLFPPTFKGRPNGMRVDLAEALQEMGPSFFRFPGGNNLEGQTVATRWQWNATVGPLLNRPGRMGDWSYINTENTSGIGLMEYLEWCEDLNMIPIMGIWAGYALGGTSVPQNQLGPYIQQAADQINFVIRDPARSAAAALRASLGRTQPFSLKYVEVGNEVLKDFFAATSYVYRWREFVTALQAQFPSIHFIATTNTFNPVLTPNPTEYDVHVYQTPTWFAQNSFFYDGFQVSGFLFLSFAYIMMSLCNRQRNGTKYFEGEYAAISTNRNDIFDPPSNGRLVYPTMQNAAGEAAFMTGLERNGDIVCAAAYAPLIGHPALQNWNPLLECRPQELGKSNHYKDFEHGHICCSTDLRSSLRERRFKWKRTGPYGWSTTSNTPSSPNAIVPITSTVATGKMFNYNAPPVSVSVLTFAAS